MKYKIILTETRTNSLILELKRWKFKESKL